MTEHEVNIFNKECGDFSEIEDNSIDCIITGPPYNIGHTYGELEDRIETKEYLKNITSFIQGSFRVLKNDCYLVVDIAEYICQGNDIWIAPQYIVNNATNVGFNFIDFFQYLPSNSNQFFPFHSKTNMNCFLKSPNFDHSPFQLILIFQKGKYDQLKKQFRFKRKYEANQYDEAFWSANLINDFLNNFFKRGFKFLDPFFGSGELGMEVLKKGGSFYGYEKSRELFNKFKEKIE